MKRLLPLLAVLLVPSTGLADPVTYYVATTGSDSNDGLSSATAFLTLSNAVEKAGANEAVILIAPGTYEQSAAIRVEAPLSIRGTGAAATNVILRNTTSGQHVITIAHADAELALVTLANGSAKTGPACLGIEAGVVRDCRVTGCSYQMASGGVKGGTVAMSGGRLMRSTIDGNTITWPSWNSTCSAGVYATAGVVENCLIQGNSITVYNNTQAIETSALSLAGTSRAVNCTIVGNNAKWNDDTRKPMTTHVASGAKIVNCVIFGNACNDPARTVWAGTAENYVNCFSEESINATCTAIVYPGFADPDNGDYTPVYASPLKDTGSNSDYSSDAVSATDIKGDTRILHGAIDVGAFEYVPAMDFAVDFSYMVNRRLLPASVTFTALPENATGPVTYQWDFDSDGTIDRQTSDSTITVELDVAKIYNVTLEAVCGTAEATAYKPQVVKAIQKDVYVATDGSNAYPYATPATAATTIQEALDAAEGGCSIHVLPGTYLQTIPFTLDRAIALASTTTNANDVILKNTRSSTCVGTVAHENAVLAGVTLTGGTAPSPGAALTLTAGIVRDCRITGNSIGGEKDKSSGTVWMSGGRLMRCRIVGNSGGTSWNVDCAGGVNATGGIVDTCLVATNRVTYYGDKYTTALGIKLTGTAVAVNCTIVSNVCVNPDRISDGKPASFPMATSASANARFVNCLIWDNVTKDGDEYRYVWNGTAASYVKCYSELTINETSPAISDPGFADATAGDYSPTSSSPLIDKGADYAAAGGLSAFDLSGVQKRLIGSHVDIGCYEANARGTLLLVK